MAAEQEHAGAQYSLGAMYANGQSVDQSFTKAREWLTKAASQGYENAINALKTLDKIEGVVHVLEDNVSLVSGSWPQMTRGMVAMARCVMKLTNDGSFNNSFVSNLFSFISFADVALVLTLSDWEAAEVDQSSASAADSLFATSNACSTSYTDFCPPLPLKSAFCVLYSDKA